MLHEWARRAAPGIRRTVPGPKKPRRPASRHFSYARPTAALATLPGGGMKALENTKARSPLPPLTRELFHGFQNSNEV